MVRRASMAAAVPGGPAAPGPRPLPARGRAVEQAHDVLAVIAGDPAALIQELLLLPARRLAIARVDHFDVLPLGVCRHDVTLPLGLEVALAKVTSQMAR